MWVKLAGGELEWITGLRVSGATMQGRMANGAQMVLHTYSSPEEAEKALAVIVQIVPIVVEFQSPEEEDETDSDEVDG